MYRVPPRTGKAQGIGPYPKTIGVSIGSMIGGYFLDLSSSPLEGARTCGCSVILPFKA